VKRHIRYLTCRRCGQVDNIACPACRERMQQRKHKQGLRDALRAAGLTSSHDPEYSRRYHLLKQHGVTLEWYAERLAEQAGVCAICRRPPAKKPLSVDHNHRTKMLRGLLCFRCNYLLGMAGDSILRLEAAVLYLRRHDAGLPLGPAAALGSRTLGTSP